MFSRSQVPSPEALKKRLADTSGSTLIGRGASTIDADLTATEQKSARLASKGEGHPVAIVDMHYGVLRGMGWHSSEAGGQETYQVTTAGTKGDNSIICTTTNATPTTIQNDQLICYVGTDGQYYTGIAKSVTAGAILMREPIEADIAIGTNVRSFWNNESHPNEFGYRAIIDYAYRTTKCRTKVGSPVFEQWGGATVAASADNNKNNTGSANASALVATANTGGYTEGLKTTFCPKKTGAYVFRVRINCSGLDSKIMWDDGQSYGDSVFLSNETPETVEVKFYVRQGVEKVNFYLSSNNVNDFIIVNETAEIFKEESTDVNLNRGTHVLLGDSWFVHIGQYVDDWYALRYPDATFINEGVGGNTALNLLNRFDADVTPHNPTHVWIMVGTNDVYASVSPALFNFYIQKLKAKIEEIGARAIIFTGYVGSADESTTRFDYSRQYAVETDYFDTEYEIVRETRQVLSVPPTTVADGSDKEVLFLGKYNDDTLKILTSYFTHDCEIMEKTSIGDTGTSVQTLSSGEQLANVIVSHTDNRYLSVRVSNSSGGDINFRGYMVIGDEVIIA